MDEPEHLRVLRVADVYGGFQGGVRNYMLRSGAALARATGWEVSYRWHEDMLAGVQKGGVRRLLVPWAVALAAWRERDRWDVVEVHEPLGAVYGILRVLLRRRVLPPLALLSYGLEGRSWAALRERSRRTGAAVSLKSRITVPLTLVSQALVAAKTADVVIVPSSADAEHLVNRLRVPARRVVIAPTGVEPEFLEGERRERASEQVKLIFVGSWIDRKGVPELARAWEALASDERLSLTLAGIGVTADAALASLPDAHAERVRVIPSIEPDELREQLLEHDIFVLPTWFEGMPLSMLEAAACGLPCVVGAVCGVIDFFPDGEAEAFGAITIPPHDSGALTRALKRLIDDPQRRRELGARARLRAASYTWEDTARRLAGAYREALGLAPRPGAALASERLAG